MFCPVNVPMRGEIKYAEPKKPFLVMSMKIDIESVSKILLKMLLNAYYSCTKIQKILGFLHRLSNKKYIIDSLQANKVANLSGMSLSGFHSHFKKITSLSPLQYQKSLRLMEARRLIAQEGRAITETAYQVGYESPSQFSREYKRYFGHAPKGDIK